MTKHVFIRWCARFLLLAIFLLTCLMCTSCKAVKRTVHKKTEKVSELTHHDLKTSERIEADISTLRISKNDRLIITPVDNQKQVQVIQGKDTLKFSNARIDINSSSTKEQVKDKTVTEKTGEEKTVSKKETSSTQKDVDKEKKGTSPALIWGLIVAVLLVGAFFYFKKKIPFL